MDESETAKSLSLQALPLHTSVPIDIGPVIITGCALRVGRAIAEHLAARGYPICIHYRHSASAANILAAGIRDRGGSAVTVAADFTEPAKAVEQIYSACSTLGRPTLLINNASVFAAESLMEITSESFDATMATNLKAPLLLSQRFADCWSGAHSHGADPQIINIADWRGLRPIPGHLTYTLTKASLIALTELLALELAPTIRVNAIAPGALLPASSGPEPTPLERRNPLLQVGGTEAVVRAIEYLCTARFVTGEVMKVTGGEELAIQRGH